MLAVLLFHGGVSWMSGGYLGVDAFFVLSGFLITSLLLREWQSAGRIDLSAFWIRRARRLLPALFLVLGAVCVYALVLASPEALDRLRADALATLGYGANWRFVLSSEGYFDFFAEPSPLRHAWSLAIEEQFYLVWPLVVLGWFRLWRGRATSALRSFVVLCAGLAAASALLMVALFESGAGLNRVYYGTDTRAQAVLIGAALAALLRARPAPAGSGRRVLGAAAVVAALVTLGLWVVVPEGSRWLFQGGLVVAGLAVAVVIARVAHPEPGIVGRVLSMRVLRWIGVISYGLYLWHWPVYVVLSPQRTALDGAALLALRLGVTLACACASYVLVERPIRRGAIGLTRTSSGRAGSRRAWPRSAWPRSGWPRGGWVIVPAAVAALVAAILATTAGGRPPFELPEPSAAALPPPAVAGERGAHRVLVVGDSVALTLAEGLREVGAEQRTVVANAGYLGCGLISSGEIWYYGEVQEILGECAQWPDRWARAVAESVPDTAVVLIGATDGYDRRLDGEWVLFGTPAWDEVFLADVRHAVDVLSAGGARVVFLTVPYYEHRYGNTVDDLDRSIFEPSRVDRLNAMLREVAASDDRVDVVDLNHFLSPDGRIHETIDGMVVQGDGVHFTEEGRRYVARWLLPEVVRG